MAVTNNYYQQQQKQQKVQQAQPYTGLKGLSQTTQQQLGNMQAGYKPSEQVLQAQQHYQQVQQQKPGEYQSKYAPQLDSILEQIQNPGEFKYEFNGDNLFKAYADMYTQMGKQASLDAQGQAAGLTGGYGNSYGQQVGQQAYQQNLIPLYDRGMDLRDRAYGERQDDLTNKKDTFSLMSQQEQTDYNRYRDLVGDWQTAEEQAHTRLKDAADSDFNKYQILLGYWQGLAEVENGAYQSEQELQETIRQFNETMAENIREFDAELAETIRSNKANEDINWAQIDAQYGDHSGGSSGSSGSSSSSSTDGSGTPAATQNPSSSSNGLTLNQKAALQSAATTGVSSAAKQAASTADLYVQMAKANPQTVSTVSNTSQRVGSAVVNSLNKITQSIR